MKKYHKTFIRFFSWIMFIIYLIELVYFLFFSEQMGRVPSDTYKYSLIPFKEIKRYLRYSHTIGYAHVMLNLAGNVFCFMPFGFVLPIIARKQRSLPRIAISSFLASLLVELIQLVSKVGSCDVDDIMLNTCGGVVGYIAFKIGYCLWNRWFGSHASTVDSAQKAAQKEEKYEQTKEEK